MTAGFVDSTVIIHVLRKNPSAKTWLATQPILSVTSIVWLEVIYGARGRRGQYETLQVLNSFELVYLTQQDQAWAMQRMLAYRLSHGIAMMDCLVASVCHRLQVPIYTDNVRDFRVLLSPALVH